MREYYSCPPSYKLIHSCKWIAVIFLLYSFLRPLALITHNPSLLDLSHKGSQLWRVIPQAIQPLSAAEISPVLEKVICNWIFTVPLTKLASVFGEPSVVNALALMGDLLLYCLMKSVPVLQAKPLSFYVFSDISWNSVSQLVNDFTCFGHFFYRCFSQDPFY